jgi:hypothetical protein
VQKVAFSQKMPCRVSYDPRIFSRYKLEISRIQIIKNSSISAAYSIGKFENLQNFWHKNAVAFELYLCEDEVKYKDLLKKTKTPVNTKEFYFREKDRFIVIVLKFLSQKTPDRIEISNFSPPSCTVYLASKMF